MYKKSKYMVANDRDRLWGLTVDTVGYEEILPGDDYPTIGHADGYYFDINKGRILHEFQLLYITDGNGVFQSNHQPLTTVATGDMFLLFPGEWHNYHPDNKSGWRSYWIGFRGLNMDKRMDAKFISVQKPIYHIGYDGEVEHLFKQALDTAIEEGAYAQQLLSGIVNHLIGLMFSLERNRQLNKDHVHAELINKAKLMIRETVSDNISIQEIATKLGVSYSNFRKLFKEYVGIGPALYQQDLKLQRAKELLSTTNKSIKEIAYSLNFDSPDYFSSKFRNKTGMKPSEFRDSTR